MLSLRPEQIEDLRSTREAQLKEALFAEARGPWRERCANLADAQLRDAVDQTVARALAHGVASDRGITLFFRIALGWGLHFTANPQIPWIYPVHVLPGEAAEDWVARVHDIALATAKKEKRWTWTKTT